MPPIAVIIIQQSSAIPIRMAGWKSARRARVWNVRSTVPKRKRRDVQHFTLLAQASLDYSTRASSGVTIGVF
jgi:hypothetical protein